MSLIRQMRGGKDYDAKWAERQSGTGPYAWQIARRFELATKKLGSISAPAKAPPSTAPSSWSPAEANSSHCFENANF